MREYKIKRGHNPDVSDLVNSYFGVQGDIYEGIEFETDGIGQINIKQEKNSLFVDIVPPKKICSDFNVIKRWNQFLFDATGKDAKARKKEFGKVK